MRRASVDMTCVGHVYSVGFDLVPSDPVSFGMKYGWEKYTALLASRMANPAAGRYRAVLQRSHAAAQRLQPRAVDVTSTRLRPDRRWRRRFSRRGYRRSSTS